eukprot:752948-Hanusia_phi.AAC.2
MNLLADGLQGEEVAGACRATARHQHVRKRGEGGAADRRLGDNPEQGWVEIVVDDNYGGGLMPVGGEG